MLEQRWEILRYYFETEDANLCLSSMYSVYQITFFFGKCFKKKTIEYFLKILISFESIILPVNNGK